MRCIILLGLATLAYCQFFNGGIFNFGGDHIHGYSFEFHQRENILIVRNATTCFVVELDKSIEDDLRHRDSREKIEDDLYAQIKAEQGETVSSINELRQETHNNRYVFECFRHDVYKLKYMSS